MQRTFSGFICSIVASCSRSRWLACDGVQTVSRPFLKSATAHDGPIDPCVFIARSYVACSVRPPALQRCGRIARRSGTLRCGRPSSCARTRRAATPRASPAQSDHLATIACRGADRGPFVGRDDRQEVALAHRADVALDLAASGVVEALQRRRGRPRDGPRARAACPAPSRPARSRRSRRSWPECRAAAPACRRSCSPSGPSAAPRGSP